ncbi:MAG: hypothetical protein WD294_03320 [Phycisphaeraceae bacterium]
MDDHKHYAMDSRFEKYQSFFDHRWARHFSEAAVGKGLSEASFNLLFSWKAAANAFRLPWSSVMMLKNFAEAAMIRKTPPEDLLAALAAKVSRNMDGSWTTQHAEALRSEIAVLSDQISSAMEAAAPYAFDPATAWEELIKDHEFAMSVIANTRNAYVAVWQGYENFVVWCVRHKTGTTIRIDRNFPGRLCKAFNVDIARHCWIDARPEAARLIRNAIVHNGARETPQLQRIEHDIAVINGELQIWPDDVAILYNHLQQCVDQLVDGI